MVKGRTATAKTLGDAENWSEDELTILRDGLQLLGQKMRKNADDTDGVLGPRYDEAMRLYMEVLEEIDERQIKPEL